MNVIEAIKIRKSVRAYRDQPVEEEKLQQVLKAAHLAPSASNRQEWRFIVVRDPETKNKIAWIAGNQQFIAEADVVIVACAKTDEHLMRCEQPCYPIDVAIALDHLTLAAVELGLGTCWIGNFDEGNIKELLGIPDGIRVVELMPLGYAADPSPVKKQRMPLHTIVKYEHW